MDRQQPTAVGRRPIVTMNFVAIAVGFVIIYAVLDRVAAGTDSRNGEYGALICLAVIAAALIVERVLFATPPLAALRALGFGRPTGRALTAAFVISAALLAYLPFVAAVTGENLTLREGWPVILIGVFLQGGIAEELLWRGYLFRHFREKRGFWRAASIAMGFTLAQHLLLLWQLPLPVAMVALAVAIAISFPLAYLFERGANTIWAPALVHFVVQGTLKIVILPESILLATQLGWMAISIIAPFAVFFIWRKNGGRHR